MDSAALRRRRRVAFLVCALQAAFLDRFFLIWYGGVSWENLDVYGDAAPSVPTFIG